ncbi:MAG: hypothetical protein AB1Z67_08990, partial [Candidatus Limnocylindrales bacterium]
MAHADRSRLLPLLLALVALAALWLMPDIETEPIDFGPSASEAWRAVIVDTAPPLESDDPFAPGNEMLVEFREGP